MKVMHAMTSPAIPICPEESVSVAARTLQRYNIGALPVCSREGKLCGMLTDRDIVMRCLASGRHPETTTVGEIMSGNVHCATPDMELGVAAHLMGRQQVRRLPVVKDGRLCGMVSLGDIAITDENAYDAADALTEIADNINRR